MRYQKSVEAKIKRIAAKFWKDHLATGGDRFITLDPKQSGSAWTVTIQLSTGFSIGDRKFTRTIQRSFSAGKVTKVPAVFADRFLENSELIEVKDGERLVATSDWPDTIE